MEDKDLKKSEIDENIEDTKQENLEDEYVEKYKKQLNKDEILYDKNILEYEKWTIKIKDLKLNVKNTFDETKKVIDEFNDSITKKIDNLEEEEKRVVLNRQKGINMINRMSQNVLINIMDKDLKIEESECLKASLEKEITGKSKEEMRDIANRNYSVISNISKSKDSLINIYFSFIQTSILPIIDGIQSGITFIKNSERKIVKEEIVPVYIKLEEIFNYFLSICNIQKINIKVKDKIDVRFTEILEVEYVKERELDETVESVIRNGYEYLEDIYGSGHNHILRSVQIIANKRD